MNKEKYTLQEVTTPALEREWLDFPKRIYKGNRNWVCPLDVDVLEVFNPSKNELFADGEAIRWVARDAVSPVFSGAPVQSVSAARIMGIVNGDDFQIVYSDTPGILKPSYRLQESMMKFVAGALKDADVILYVTDTVERGDETSQRIVDGIATSGIPVIVVINKIDLTSQEALEW